MTIEELRAARHNGRPVILRTITNAELEYPCVKSIMQRTRNGRIEYQAVLEDYCGHSITRCDPAGLRYKEDSAVMPSGTLVYDPEEDRCWIDYPDKPAEYLRGGQRREGLVDAQWITTQLDFVEDAEAWRLIGVDQTDISGLSARMRGESI